MKKLRNIILLLIVVVLLCGCSVKEQITINNDGTVVEKIYVSEDNSILMEQEGSVTEIVEERASLKGLFLEHRNCKRKFIKEVVVPPKGTVLADVKPIEYEIKPKKKKTFSTQEHLLKSGSIAFIDGKVIQPVKLNLK